MLVSELAAVPTRIEPMRSKADVQSGLKNTFSMALFGQKRTKISENGVRRPSLITDPCQRNFPLSKALKNFLLPKSGFRLFYA